MAATNQHPQASVDIEYVHAPDAGPVANLFVRAAIGRVSLQQRPEVRNPRPWLNGALAAGAAALAIRRGLHRRASG